MTQRSAHGMSGWHFLGWLGLHRQTKFQVPISCLVVVVVVSRINLQNVNHWPGKLKSYFYHQLWHHLVLLRLAQGLVKNPCEYSFPVGFLQNVTKLWTLFGHILDKCPNYGLLFGNILDKCPKFGHLFGHNLDKCPNFGHLFGHILDKCPNSGHFLDTFWKGVQILVTILDRCPNFGNLLGTFWTYFGHICPKCVYTNIVHEHRDPIVCYNCWIPSQPTRLAQTDIDRYYICGWECSVVVIAVSSLIPQNNESSRRFFLCRKWRRRSSSVSVVAAAAAAAARGGRADR